MEHSQTILSLSFCAVIAAEHLRKAALFGACQNARDVCVGWVTQVYARELVDEDVPKALGGNHVVNTTSFSSTS